MLNPAYQALLRIQSKISRIKTLEEIKELMIDEADLVNDTVKVSKTNIWMLNFSALDQTVTSVKELGFVPIITKERPKEGDLYLEVEEVNALGLFALQEAFIKILQSAL